MRTASAFLAPMKAERSASFDSHRMQKTDFAVGFLISAEKTGRAMERFHSKNPDGIDGAV